MGETFSEWLIRTAQERAEYPEPQGFDEAVPAPSEEYQKGHRDGYALRMAEEQSDRQLFASPPRVDQIRSLPPSAECGPLDPEGAVARNLGSIWSEKRLRDLSQPIEENSPVGRALRKADPDPYRTAAVPSEGDDAASFRPTAPSLNGCWNRLDAQGALIQAERTENFNRYQSIQAELHQIQADLDRLDDRADEALLRQDRAVGEINERIAGDVHAIKERLETIGSNHHAEYCDESTDAGHSSSHGLDSR